MSTLYDQPKPDSRNYLKLINDIEGGVIKIPKFQREFVWPIEKTAALLDSIAKGYPIGTFILWKTRARMAVVRDIGNIKLPETPTDTRAEYVLDGQQRMTSLFAAYRGTKITRVSTSKEIDFEQIYVNLDPDLPSDEPIVVVNPSAPHRCVQLKRVLIFDFPTIKAMETEGFTPAEMEHSSKLHKAFTTYEFSQVTLTREDIDSAIDVFTRINTGGSILTLFEIMVAKTYDEIRSFDMHKKWSELKCELDDVGYDGMPPSVILNLLSLVLSKTGECKRPTILALEKDDIIKAWPDAVSALKSAVDYFRTQYRIPVSALLPYDAMLVPFAYWFYRRRAEPVGVQRLQMQSFFWRAALSSRYASSTETKLAADKRGVDDILAGGPGNWSDLENDDLNIRGPEHLIALNFATGNSLCKAILSLLAYEEPKNPDSGGKVLLDNSHLKIASSKNYHHFFPKAHLRNKKIENENSIVNITLVGAALNKHVIRARAPHDYIAAFEATNPAMTETLKTHLIDRRGMGIDEDDYEAFLAARAQKIWAMINVRINPIIGSAAAAAPTPALAVTS